MADRPNNDSNNNDRAWFLSHVDQVVDLPVEPAWDDLLSRLVDDAPAAGQPGIGARRSRIALAAAAAAIVVVGGVLVGIRAAQPGRSTGARVHVVDPTTPASTSATTTTTATTTTGLPTEEQTPAGWIRSADGVPVDNDRPSGSFGALDGLTMWLEVQTDGTIGPMVPAAARIAYLNTTSRPIEITECTDLLVRRGLVPANDPDAAVEARMIIDCYATPVATVAPGHVVRRDLGYDGDPGFTARRYSGVTGGRYLGALPAGDYLAVAEVQGSDRTVRMSVPVTVAEPPCALTDDFVERYLGLTERQAAARAEADGLTSRVVRRDGVAGAVTDDLRCDRLDLVISAGMVQDVSRG